MQQKPRFLTPECKAIEMEAWQQILKKWAAAGRPHRPDVGTPDASIIKWCDRINEIDGVATLQSCTGHLLKNDYQSGGHLWLWLDEQKSNLFRRNAFALALTPDKLIEQVSIIFSSWGQEVAEIVFRGMNCSPDVFNESMRAIYSFLTLLDR